MKTFIDRRSFLKGGLVLSAAGALGLRTRAGWGAGTAPGTGPGSGVDLAVVQGGDPFRSAWRAVEAVGGLDRRVSGGSLVGLLINHPFRNPGTFVNPDVALAVAVICLQSGAREVRSLKAEPSGYWARASQAGRWPSELKALKPCRGDYVRTRVEKGLALKEGQIIRDLLECDVFVNVSITKDHEGTGYSGVLKNMMGAATHSTCRFFHTGSGAPGWYGDVDHLSQCIADLNLLRRPDLAVADATEIIRTNGPFGPGDLARPGKVLAGTDPVLVDAYGTTILGLKPEGVGLVVRSAEAGLGRPDLEKARVVELRV